jgi:hypothetical protein
LAASRWQQQQSLSVSIAGFKKESKQSQSEAEVVCQIDRIRPSKSTIHLGGQVEFRASSSVIARRDEGKTLRQNIYKKINIDLVDLKFTDDLQTLSAKVKTIPESTGNLSDKIAVLYADGNGFGAIANAAAEKDELAKWDEDVRSMRSELMKKIVEAAKKDKGMLHANDTLRLETLLWGGDEFIFVVPAWRGWALWRFVHEQTNEWKYDRKALTHAFGLTFSHAKAPIHRIVRLAKSLADEGKKVTKETSTLTWNALESFDHLGLALDEGLARRCQKKIVWADWVMTADQAIAMDDGFREMKPKLPKSQIVNGAMAHVFDSKNEVSEKRKKLAFDHVVAEDAGGQSMCSLIETLSCKADGVQNESSAWLQLAEAWDYCGLSTFGEGK